MPRPWMLLVGALAFSPLAALGDFTTTFENTGLAPNSVVNNAGPSGAFTIDGNQFNNSFSHDSTYGDSWSGWALSNQTDTTTPGYKNQYSSITGSGVGGSATYAVGFTYGPSADPFHPANTTIALAAGMTPKSIQITNTTFSYLSMRDGDSFVSAFKTGDFQLLDIRGYDSTGRQLGDVNFYLADFRSTNPAQHFIVNTWQTVDLTSLAGSTNLQFGIQSSQNDPTFGVNTPAYFAADNFTFGPTAAVPEPASLALVAVALALGGLVSRRRMVA